MEIIVINKKSEFTGEQINKLEEQGKVTFLESVQEWNSLEKIITNEDTVLAIDPGITDWEVSNDILEKIPNLKGVCLPSTAYEWVDGEYLKKKGVPLINVPKYSTEAVAEHMIMMVLCLAKKLPLIISNGWELDYDKHLGMDLKGKKMGVVGLGTIGTRVAELGQAMGMEVSYYSPNSRDRRFDYMELLDLAKDVDFLCLAMITSDETKNIINSDIIDQMKETACIVDISIGGVLDLDYAIDAVRNGKLGGTWRRG